MRTTVRLDEELLEMVKVAAERSGRTVARFVEDAVRHQLALEQEPAPSPGPGLPTFRGTGLRPGVDVDSNASVLAVLEGDG